MFTGCPRLGKNLHKIDSWSSGFMESELQTHERHTYGNGRHCIADSVCESFEVDSKASKGRVCVLLHALMRLRQSCPARSADSRVILTNLSVIIDVAWQHTLQFENKVLSCELRRPSRSLDEDKIRPSTKIGGTKKSSRLRF